MTPWSPNAMTRLAAVIGDPVTHSLSPVLHNAAFRDAGLNWVFSAFTVASGDASQALDAMRVLGIAGLSVTMPHKTDVAEACDELTADAAQLQSVNCVSLTSDGRLLGDSTDGAGFVASLRDAEVDPNGRSVALIGGGGAARSVALALARAGASVVVTARQGEAAGVVAALQTAIGTGEWARRTELTLESDIIVQCTPVGMLGDPSVPFDVAGLTARHCVADLVYTPIETPLLRAAAQAGAVVVDGLGMLIHQAALAFTTWTGVAPSIAVMRAAAMQELGRRASSS